MRKTIAVLLLAALPLAASSPTEMGIWRTELDIWFRNNAAWTIPQARDAVFSPDGTTMAVALLNGTVELVRIRDKKTLTVFDCSLAQEDDFTRPVCLDFSPDGSRLAIGFWSGRTILIADIKEQRILRRIKTTLLPRRLSFSPLGRHLLVAGTNDNSGWNQVYGFFGGKMIFDSSVPVPLTFSREDRYIYRIRVEQNSRNLVMQESDTGRAIKVLNWFSLGVMRRPLVLHSLRDHRILIGFSGQLSLADRFFTEITGTRPTGRHVNAFLLTMADARHLVSTGAGSSRLYRLHDGRWSPLPLPAGAMPRSAHPGGNAILWYNAQDNSVSIHRFEPTLLVWRKEPPANQ